MVARKNLTIEVESPVVSPLPTTSTTKTKHMTFPDVPRDIDSLTEEHWNDPNYDVNGLPSPTASSTDSFELESKGRRGSTTGYSASDFRRRVSLRLFQGTQPPNPSSLMTMSSAPPSNSDRRAFLTTKSRESPYPEVRAAVSNIDDPTMPVNTIRM